MKRKAITLIIGVLITLISPAQVWKKMQISTGYPAGNPKEYLTMVYSDTNNRIIFNSGPSFDGSSVGYVNMGVWNGTSISYPFKVRPNFNNVSMKYIVKFQGKKIAYGSYKLGGNSTLNYSMFELTKDDSIIPSNFIVMSSEPKLHNNKLYWKGISNSQSVIFVYDGSNVTEMVNYGGDFEFFGNDMYIIGKTKYVNITSGNPNCSGVIKVSSSGVYSAVAPSVSYQYGQLKPSDASPLLGFTSIKIYKDELYFGGAGVYMNSGNEVGNSLWKLNKVSGQMEPISQAIFTPTGAPSTNGNIVSMAKRILFTTTAGTGHFNPMVPFAKELQSQGHTVKIAAPESFRTEIEKAGFELLSFNDVAKDDPRVGAVFAKGHNTPFEEMQTLVGKVIFGLTNTEAALQKMPLIIKEYNPELIISETAEFSGSILAIHHKIPFIRFSVGLSIADQMLVKHCVEGTEPLLDSYNISKDQLFNFLTESDYLTYFPESLEDLTYSAPKGKTIRLIHESIENGKAGKDHDKNQRPFIYVTFGTVASQIGFYPRIIQQLVDGLKELPVDAIITVGNKADPKEIQDIPENFEVLQWKDQDEIFNKADIVISHVGSGTMLGSLAFGLPLIAIPLFADQFMNAERLNAINAAIKLEPDDKLSQTIKDAVEEVLNDKKDNKKIAEEMAKQHTSLKEAIEQLHI